MRLLLSCWNLVYHLTGNLDRRKTGVSIFQKYFQQVDWLRQEIFTLANKLLKIAPMFQCVKCSKAPMLYFYTSERTHIAIADVSLDRHI